VVRAAKKPPSPPEVAAARQARRRQWLAALARQVVEEVASRRRVAVWLRCRSAAARQARRLFDAALADDRHARVDAFVCGFETCKGVKLFGRRQTVKRQQIDMAATCDLPAGAVADVLITLAESNDRRSFHWLLEEQGSGQTWVSKWAWPDERQAAAAALDLLDEYVRQLLYADDELRQAAWGKGRRASGIWLHSSAGIGGTDGIPTSYGHWRAGQAQRVNG
jgi:hypothetical protein